MTSDETVKSLKTQIKAKIGQTFLEFPMADADACKYGNHCFFSIYLHYIQCNTSWRGSHFDDIITQRITINSS